MSELRALFSVGSSGDMFGLAPGLGGSRPQQESIVVRLSVGGHILHAVAAESMDRGIEAFGRRDRT